MAGESAQRLGFIGASFPRYNHLFALTLAVVLLESRRLALSGFFFAASTAFRVFPVAMLGGVFLHHALRRDASSTLWARLAVAAAMFALALTRWLVADPSDDWLFALESIEVGVLVIGLPLALALVPGMRGDSRAGAGEAAL